MLNSLEWYSVGILKEIIFEENWQTVPVSIVLNRIDDEVGERNNVEPEPVF